MYKESENRFAWIWSEYVKELHLDPNLSLRKFCGQVYTDNVCMRKWVSTHGYSVLKLKKEHSAEILTSN